MKYLSLFSGIGGFELGIQSVFPNAECVGYSEVDKFAVMVYEKHFPTHKNLGDITKITKNDIERVIKEHGHIDLVVGGFPCQNLSSIARYHHGDKSGLNGQKSSLFYDLLRILQWVKSYNSNVHFIIENNASMSATNRDLITAQLQNVCKDNHDLYRTMIDAAWVGVQRRRRFYWTTFKIDTKSMKCSQTWNNILAPVDDADIINSTRISNSFNKQFSKRKNASDCKIATHVSGNMWKFETIPLIDKHSRWQQSWHSDTACEKGSTCLAQRNFANVLVDRRSIKIPDCFLIRYLSPIECERLFWFPDGWVSHLCSKTRSFQLLGNTVVVKVIEYILLELKIKFR